MAAIDHRQRPIFRLNGSAANGGGLVGDFVSCRHLSRDNSRYWEQSLESAVVIYPTHNEDAAMDKDRIKGSAEQIKGPVKEATGKALGDKNLEAEGKTDKAVGRVQTLLVA